VKLSAYLERLYISEPRLFIELARAFGVYDVEVKEVYSVRDRNKIVEQVERLVDAMNAEIKRYRGGYDNIEDFIDSVLEERVEGYKSIYSFESKIVFLAENKEELRKNLEDADLRVIVDKFSLLGEAVKKVLEMHMEETWQLVRTQIDKMRVKEKEGEQKKRRTKRAKNTGKTMKQAAKILKKIFRYLLRKKLKN